jgi:cyclophilin family peptidyl-prolyl cis-trans isomerase
MTMKLLPSLIALALISAPVISGAEPAPAAKLVPKAKDSEAQAAAQKAAADAEAKKAADAAEKKKTHTVAVMDVKFGRESGEVMFELFPEDAPKTVENFRSNAEKGVYNGLAVHRAVKNYLVQTGDSASKDDKARETWGLTQAPGTPAEIKRPHILGAVAMARRNDKVNPDKKSDGTQFYFVLGDMSGLDGQYTVFGQVVSGLDVLRKISRVVTDSNDCPVVRVEVKKLVVYEQQGPLITMVSTGKRDLKRITKPDAMKSAFERFLERIW